jgi:3-oxoacyl-[acyl-carrier-protein] synthase II
VGDAAEAAALKSIFGDGAGAVAVSSTKSATGHMLGAAGAIEAVFSVLSLQAGVLPPSLNIEEPMSEIRDFDCSEMALAGPRSIMFYQMHLVSVV